MKRKTLDKLLSSAGLLIGVVLLMTAFGAAWAHTFIHNQVHDQLVAEKVYFPNAGTAALTSLPATDRAFVAKYAGQEMQTGAQAEVFADHYIAVHLKEIGGGLTYSELSAQSLADPTNQALSAKVNTVFRGETLRGMLLNAYAFDTMATVSMYASYIALCGGVLLLILAVLGFKHAGKVSGSKR